MRPVLNRLYKTVKTILVLSVISTVSVSAASAASLSLSPSSHSAGVGETFSVNMVLDTQGVETSGTDVVILYDSNVLEVVSLEEGTIYGTYPLKTASGGVITMSGVITTGTETGFTGSGTFGTINFRPLAEGTTEVLFDFTPGATTDSNVVEKGTGQDVLNSVSDGVYTLVAGVGTTAIDTTDTTTETTVTTGADIPAGTNSVGLLLMGLGLILSSVVWMVRQET